METKDTENGVRSQLPVDKSDAHTTPEDEFPAGTTRFDCQVAGHCYDPKKNKIGLLRGANGRVLKSAENPVLREREISFYDNLQRNDDPIYRELSMLTPNYYGIIESTYKNKPIKFLVLNDITEGMTEPCIMDVKIGRRTWDPLAGLEKREADDRKYAASKKAYGFSIPGFQVYNLATGELQKFNKDYGKKLDAEGVIDALKIFLNAEPGRLPYRELVVKVLSYLWKVLAFFRCQRKLRFYASSLLIVYDAQRLRNYIRTCPKEPRGCEINTRGKTFSSYDVGLSDQPTSNPLSSFVVKTNRKRALDRARRLKRSTSLSGQDFPISTQTTNLRKDDAMLERSESHGRCLDENFDSLCRTHSYSNNYDRDIMEMKEDYAIVLEKLTGKSRQGQNWVRVNMIDFTHVFDAEDDSPDTNYLEGIENLIKILETFL